ncbi:hypothetical protein Bca52824_001952 [Brassica carinata]|uniref:Uncharacterized protein n=1 Tax=Brassica carinata TaxID=52824 RepID=A0A8X8BDJ1_BRACI|nr:hypothetical protein Bca52824_001952 [Brassica carinata]
MVLRARHVVLETIGEDRTLKVGSTLFISETRAPFGRVVGYYFGFGYVRRPWYVVRMESDIKTPRGTLIPLVVQKIAEFSDEEDLFKRFNDPVKAEFDIFEEEEEEVNDCQSTTTKRRRMSSEEEEISNSKTKILKTCNHYEGQCQDNFNQLLSMQPHQVDIVPRLLQILSQTLMMYNQQQQLTRPEINQPNQMGFVSNLLPSQAPVMYNQQHGFRNNQITELGQHNLIQPFGMFQQPFLNATAPMVYNPPQQFMRHEINQPNQMGIVPNPHPFQAPMMYNQQYGSQTTEPNLGAQVSTMFVCQKNPNQPFGMPQQPSQSAVAPVMYNQQHQSMRPVTNQQNQMSSMRMFNAGQSSYRGRGGHRSKARGLGRGGRD